MAHRHPRSDRHSPEGAGRDRRPERPAHAPAAPDAVLPSRLRTQWESARRTAATAPAGSPTFARVADLTAVLAGAAIRAGDRMEARAIVGDALATLNAACRAGRADATRHVALARTLELAAAQDAARGDVRAAFDALRAAIATVGRFAPCLADRSSDPFLRIAVAGPLIRLLSGAARMVEDREQRLGAFRQSWSEAWGWAASAKGSADHSPAIEAAVIAAFELAVEEHEDSASACLDRCEELRPHLDALQDARGPDAVVRTHRAALARLCADAWQRLGDPDEADRLLDEAADHLAAAECLPGTDPREIGSQRAALARQRRGRLPLPA